MLCVVELNDNERSNIVTLFIACGKGKHDLVCMFPYLHYFVQAIFKHNKSLAVYQILFERIHHQEVEILCLFLCGSEFKSRPKGLTLEGIP